AEVYLDGSFLATARELELMVAPLAVPAGRHAIEVRAPGFSTGFEAVSLVAGEVVEVEVVLQRGPG
ncbi:MAG TPA: PEGA domain-containing protein, partial [Thermoanaerobaculales bacterium]|nr:PEGA domain-containing protein [Thermoanaerobaculales bacterium]